MTQLQNEILKLLSESNLNKEELKEVSFNDISNAVSGIDMEQLSSSTSALTDKLQNECNAAIKAMDEAMNAYKTAQEVYKSKIQNNTTPQNNTQISNEEKPVEDVPTAPKKKVASAKNKSSKKEGFFSDMKDKIDNFNINREEKKAVVDSLHNASRMMTQAQTHMNEARIAYTQIHKQILKLYKTVENVQTMIDKKSSWFGRMFGFWK